MSKTLGFETVRFNMTPDHIISNIFKIIVCLQIILLFYGYATLF